VVNGSYGLARKLYVNGVPCEVHSSSSPGSLNLGTTSSTFYAGNRQGSALQHDLIGKMANARVYSKALSTPTRSANSTSTTPPVLDIAKTW
jgi:hypothetical protein